MKKIYMALSIPAILVVFFFCLLCFGNPQWNKYIFMWQAYVWPAEQHTPKYNIYIKLPKLHEAPEKYSGVWKIWSKEGELVLETVYKNGIYHGPRKSYKRGQNTAMDNYVNGKKSGICVVYDATGKFTVSQTLYSNGYSHLQKNYLKKDELDSIKVFSLPSAAVTNTWIQSEYEIYSQKNNIDLRSKYTLELEIFEKEIAKWKKKHDIEN